MNNLNLAKNLKYFVRIFAISIFVAGCYADNKQNKDEDVFFEAPDSNFNLNGEISTDTIFSSRMGHSITKFKNKFWLIGGTKNIDTTDTSQAHKLEVYNDVWTSEDGKTWTNIKANSEILIDNLDTANTFIGRRFHQVVVFDNKLWLIGGETGPEEANSEYLGDIWSSEDGINWSRIKQNTDSTNPYFARSHHQGLVFNGEIWIIGGYGQSLSENHFRDLYKSSDGLNWQKVEANLITTKFRTQHQALVFKDLVDNKDKMWVMGGWTGGQTGENDIYKSADGVNWTQVSASTDMQLPDGSGTEPQSNTSKFSKRRNFAALTIDDKICVIGGYGSKLLQNTDTNEYFVSNRKHLTDIWLSKDGNIWSKAKIQNVQMPKYMEKTSAFSINGKLFIAGGSSAFREQSNKIYIFDID